MKGKQDSNIQQLKQQIQSLTINRQAIQNGQRISESMVNLSKTMANIKPLMKKQTQYIKTFLQAQGSSEGGNKQSQVRRYINRIYQISHAEFTQIITSAQNYFTLDLKRNWNKVKNENEKLLQAKRDKTDTNSLVQFVFSVNNSRDSLLKGFLRSLIYRKVLLFKDINLSDGSFIHREKERINKLIKNFESQLNYCPTKPLFQDLDFQKQGIWSLVKSQNDDIAFGELLKILDEQLEQVFDVVRNYSHLTIQQRESPDVNRNSAIVKNFRQQIERLNRQYQILQRKYRQAISKDQKMDIFEIRQKLKAAQDLAQSKQSELKQLKFQFRDSSNQINSLREKVKSLEDDLAKLSQKEMVKLKQLQLTQRSLSDQFSLIFKNITDFGKMFEFQSDGKKSLAREIISQKDTIEKMATMLGRQKNINVDLKTQIVRLNQIILELGNKLNQAQKKQKQ